MTYAYEKAPAFKKKMDRAKMKPQDVQAVKELERLGITEKTDLIGMQKKSPPFGGFNGVPPESLSRIFVSPGPIYEPGEMHYEDTRWAQGLFAGGFDPGIFVRLPSATTWYPLPSCWTNPCAYWVAGRFRPAWETLNFRFRPSKTSRSPVFWGPPVSSMRSCSDPRKWGSIPRKIFP